MQMTLSFIYLTNSIMLMWVILVTTRLLCKSGYTVNIKNKIRWVIFYNASNISCYGFRFRMERDYVLTLPVTQNAKTELSLCSHVGRNTGNNMVYQFKYVFELVIITSKGSVLLWKREQIKRCLSC